MVGLPRMTMYNIILVSLLGFGFLTPQALSLDTAVASSSDAAGRSEVDVGVDGSSSPPAGVSCNCSDSVSRTESLLRTCQDDLSQRLSSEAEKYPLSKLSAVQADSEERAREAARDAEKREAELKVAGLQNAVKDAETKLDASDATILKLKEEAEAKSKEWATDKERIIWECDSKGSASDNEIKVLKADLEEVKTNLAAVNEEKLVVEKDALSKLSAAQADSKERAREAARDAEKRAGDAAELKVSGLNNALKDAETKLDASDATIWKLKEGAETKSKEWAADRERIIGECEAKESASDNEIKVLRADLEEVKTNHAAVKEEKLLVVKENAKSIALLEEDIKLTEKKASDAEVVLSKCRLDIAESESSKNEVMQKMKSLKNSIKTLKDDHEKKTTKLRDELKEMKKDIERQKRLLKASNDKFHDSKKDLHNRESELRDMHRRATSQYFNTSLMMEDTVRAADKTLTNTENFLSGVWSDMLDHVGPHLSVAKEGMQAHYSKAVDLVAPYMQAAKDQYEQSAVPVINEVQKSLVVVYKEHGKPHIDPLWKEHGTPAMNKLSEIRMAMRLSFVSSVRQSSRTVATYLLLGEEGKSSRDKSPRKKRIINLLQRADKNAEDVVTKGSTWLGMSLALVFFGEYMLRLVLFFLMLPFRPFMYLLKPNRETKGQKSTNVPIDGKKKKKKKTGQVKVENNWQAQ